MKLRLFAASSALLAASLFAAAGIATAGSIKGKVTFTGDAPQRRTIQMSADPKCEEANPDGRTGDLFIVNDGGAFQNVFVYVKEGQGDTKAEPPAEPAIIDQQGCMYEPHVLGVVVGQTVEIRNSDATLHNVHALPENSKQFNNAMPMKGMTIKKRFTSPEVMVRLKCDVHPWMSAYVGVLDHPHFAVTGADGSFEIENLPAGTYTVEAWHEKAGTQTQKVTVSDDAPAAADFSFAPKT